MIKGSLFLLNMYNSTMLYMRGMKLNKKSTFSALCVCDKEIYKRFQFLFGSLGLYVMYKNPGKYMKMVSVILLLIKMETKLETILHILGYFLFNIVSVKEHYEEGNKRMALFPVISFLTLVLISLLKVMKIVDKRLFIRMYLTVQYIFTIVMTYSVCYISER